MKRIIKIFVLIVSIFVSSQVFALTVSPNEIFLKPSGSGIIRANKEKDTKIVSWSSRNPNIASVKNGIVTAHVPGTTTITVVDDKNNRATVAINVINNYVPLVNIKVSSTSETILLNTEKQLNVDITPTNASNKKLIYYSLDPSVASVSNNGLIKANKVGKTNIIIKASDTNKNISVTINVIDKIKLNAINLRKTLTLKENDTYKLTINYAPSNATDKRVTWKSMNPSIVYVDNNGNLKANAAGSTEIKAISTDGGHVASCKVTITSSESKHEEKPDNQSKEENPNDPSKEEKPVIDGKLESIKLNKETLTLKLGTEEKLELIFNPKDAKNKDVAWTSSNEKVAKVNRIGTITPVGPGEAIIKVVSKEGNKEATCKVTVVSSPLEGIEFPRPEEIVYVGTETKLKLIPSPSDALINNLKWESSNQKVATVENGILKSLSLGETKITVFNEDKTIKAELQIRVISPPEEKLMIKVSGYDLDFKESQKNYTLKIKNENALKFDINRDPKKIVIKGNNDLKNGSIITISIADKKRSTYIIKISKNKNYTLLFIIIISVLLLLNIIRMIKKNKN